MVRNRRLLGVWLIGASLTLIIGFLLSQQDRMQWYPIGGMYNFYYSVIIGTCCIFFISFKFFSIQFKWDVLLNLFVWVILYALVLGIVFPDKITSWSGSVEYRPPNLFNFGISLKTFLIGSCLVGCSAGIMLIIKTNN